MFTSYFARSYKDPNAVSISLIKPNWFNGIEYKKLAPAWDILNQFKRTKDEAIYILRYKKEILEPLNAQQVFDELGDKAILLCYEHPSRFCHRKLVAEWFKEKLGIELTEI